MTMLLVSAVPQSESAPGTHVSTFSWSSFPFRSPQSIEHVCVVEVQHGSCRAKIKAWKCCVPFWRAQRRVCSSSVSASRHCPLSLAHGPFRRQSQHWPVQSFSQRFITLMHPPAFLFHLLRTLVVAWGPQTVQENLPTSEEAG